MKRYACRLLLLFLLLTALVLLPVAGCGLREQKPPETPQAPVTQAPSVPPPPRVVEKAQGTLRIAELEPVTLDPALTGDIRTAAYVNNIFSGLVLLDDNLKPAPDIAQRWDVSADGKTYTFHLRRGVKFHSGREVKAADFKYSWERAAEPALGSLTVGTYLGDVVGVKEKLAGQARDIRGVRAVDDYTLEVQIDAPKAYFLAKMTHAAAFVVDRENVQKGENWWNQPNGTGPFKVARWKEGDETLTMERNESYYGQMARLAKVVFVHRGAAQMQLYETNAVDATSLDINYLELTKDPANPLSKQVQVTPELSVFYVGFNVARPPFDDIKVRQAFAYAADKDRIVSLIMKGTAEKANGILPLGLPGFNKDLKGPGYDPARAKQLLAESRYGGGGKMPVITYTTAGLSGGLSPIVGALIQGWQRDLGVEVEAKQFEPDFILYNLKKEKNDLFDSGWIADYPDPQNFLDVLLGTGSDYNAGEYSNREVDQLLARAGVEPDAEKRFALYRQAEEKIIQDAAIIPLSFGRNYFLVKPHVEGLRLNPLGLPTLTRAVVKGR